MVNEMVNKGLLEIQIKGELTDLKDYPHPEIYTIECHRKLKKCLELIEQAKKEFPCVNCIFFLNDELCKTRNEKTPCELFLCKHWFVKWFGKEGEKR